MTTLADSQSSGLDFSDSPINQNLSPEDKVALYRDMVRIRRFETISQQYYTKGGFMGGFLHLYTGQESVAVGIASLMGDHDHLITAYRCHGHALAVGMTMNECMAELFGRQNGCSKGKGGSMHFFAPDKNFWGGHGIVGGQIPLGIGLAYGLKYKDLKGCSVSFMGDGAVNQGAVHESYNLASLFDLPAVFVIENNGYSMGTSQKRSSAHPDCLAQRAEAYNMDWDLVNGEDILEVRAKMNIAMERAREESRPTVVEIQTYRHYGHSIADANAQKYRTPEEIQKFKNEHDPIILWEKRLAEEGLLAADRIKAISKEAMTEAKTAAKFAEDSPSPEVSDIMTDVYWESDNMTEASRIGRHFFND